MASDDKTPGPVEQDGRLEEIAQQERDEEEARVELDKRLHRPADVVGEPEYLREEAQKICASRTQRLGDLAKDSPLAGIGLSGGGIRSASLSLGVLQALAEADLLKRFDYISSVSGGGYLAGSLQWWWHNGPRQDGTAETQTTFGMGPEDFPYGPARVATTKESATTKRARRNLSFLRAHSSYLIPGNGLTNWSMLAVLTRTIVISLFIWLPLLTGCFVLLHKIDDPIETLVKGWQMWSPLAGNVPSRWTSVLRPEDGAFLYRAVYAFTLWTFYGFTAFFLVTAVVFAFVSRSPQGNSGRWAVPAYGVLIVVGVVVLFKMTYLDYVDLDVSLTISSFLIVLLIMVFATLLVAELRTDPSLNSSYWLRRKLEIFLGWAFIPAVCLLAFSLVPIIPYLLWQSTNPAVSAPTKAALVSIFGLPIIPDLSWESPSPLVSTSTKGAVASIFGLLSGVGTAVYGYYTFIRNVVPGLAAQIAATAASAIFLFATLVIAYYLALVWKDKIAGGYWPEVLLCLTVAALVLGLRANINYVGLHRFYRDRLMEAFMPTDAAVTRNKSESTPIADNYLMSDLQTPSGDIAPFPYPLINTNLILLNDKEQKYAIRGGDNFVISPLFVGSTTTEWQRTEVYIRNKGPLTLASAVAASGAAATASAGYIGTGITMNPLVAAVMSVLNVRLGLWVPNPRRAALWPFNLIPTFLYPGLRSGILSKRYTRHSRFLELTDGGHFENLGLYELVRRKLSLILIVDGEADPNISLSSLVSAARRIEQDFKVSLTFVDGQGPESLMMYDQKGYPAGLRYASEPFMVGTLRYGYKKYGTLIYLKSTLIKNIDFTTAGYLAANPTFPHQSTVDQFFDLDQFDAYRYLGYEAARSMITKLDLTATIGTPEKLRQPAAKAA